MAPWLNSRTVSGCPVPNPTWVSPRPAPRDCVTRSRNRTWLVLNPGVFKLARLLPTTSMAVEVAFSADSAVEKDENMNFSVLRLVLARVGACCYQMNEVLPDRLDFSARIDRLFQLLELRQLPEELRAVGGIQWVLMA